MTAKIVEVLARILDGLNKNFSLEEVSKILSKDNSLNKQLVSTAFSIVCDKKYKDLKYRSLIKGVEKTTRLLSEQEISFIGFDNYEYLMHLNNIGLLTVNDFNSILDQLTIFPSDRITKEELNWLILFSLIEFRENLLPGSRALLYTSDTIN